MLSDDVSGIFVVSPVDEEPVVFGMRGQDLLPHGAPGLLGGFLSLQPRRRVLTVFLVDERVGRQQIDSRTDDGAVQSVTAPVQCSG
ncbi:hypothetical protein [Streptomyces sp. NBC_01320]|uniref:hypothetical protein n=1 Tax=Streptomyces sp. NBC_01320 TaxID=2903824 RepID=UPI002E14C4F8|nr:hypothetical protein OG395_42875 [Streptomyces sp. NBC_01320]